MHRQAFEIRSAEETNESPNPVPQLVMYCIVMSQVGGLGGVWEWVYVSGLPISTCGSWPGLLLLKYWGIWAVSNMNGAYVDDITL